MTRNSLERRKVFLGRLASLSVIAFVVALALLSAACNNVNLAGKGSGTVSLAIDEVLASEIRSAIPAHLRSTTEDNSTYTLTASIRGDYSDKKTESATSLSGVTFTFEGIPTGKNIILDVTVKVGDNTIWYGNSGKHMVDSGINKLSVEVGRVSGVLLWKPEQEGKQPHDVYIAPYGNYASPFQTKFGIDTSTSQGTRRPYCFDSNGNLYAVQSASPNSQIKKYDSQLDGTYVEGSAPVDSVSNPSDVSYLAYDNDSGKLYGLGAGTSLYNLNDDVNITNNTNFPQPLGLAIHNGIAYIAEVNEGNESGGIYVTLHQYNLTSTAGDTSQKTEEIRLPEVFGTDVSALTGHMIYQDGALYLLLRRFEINDASNASVDNPVEHYSLGALAKIDPNTLTLDTSFGIGGYLGLSSSPVTFNDRKDSGKTFNVTYHGSAAENNTFFGPVGFVAVMPKKLVIGDAGFAMSADGADTVSLTKKSRVVTVDLETLAFETESVEDSYYQSEYPSSITIGYSYIVITN